MRLQKERKISQDASVVQDDKMEDNWYSDEEEEEDTKVLTNVLKKLDSPNAFNNDEESKENVKNENNLDPPFSLSGSSLPTVLTNVLTAISKGTSQGNISPGVEQERVSPPEKK